MNNRSIRLFWLGFIFTSALSVWIYWIWRQKRVVAPRPLVVSSSRTSQAAKADYRPATTQERTVVSDALEEIKGIGPVFANRLNEAGIFTYRQLASATPDEVAKITGVSRWDPAEWISQAAALAEDGLR